MGYLHDLREEVGQLLDEHAPNLDAETRKAVLDLASNKVLESYRNGLNAKSAPRAKKGKAAQR